MLDQDKNLISLISLSTLIICLLDDEWILYEEVSCQSLMGVQGLKHWTLLHLSLCQLSLIIRESHRHRTRL